MLMNQENISVTKDVLQVVILALGVLSNLFPLVKGFLKDRPQETTTTRDQQVPPVRKYSKDTTTRPRSMMDLSFVLICYGFFSFLLTDSLAISDRDPFPLAGTILYVLFITLLVVATMVGAWFRQKGEMVTGFLAITTLLVLVLSRGGPFQGAPAGYVEGISLWVPVVSLVILASSLLIYTFGSPLSKASTKRNRALISGIIVLLITIASAALGKQFVTNVVKSKYVPNLDNPEAKKLTGIIEEWDLKNRRIFYQLASEAKLAAYYQGEYLSVHGLYPVASEGGSLPTDPTPTPTPPATASPASTRTTQPQTTQSPARSPEPKPTQSPVNKQTQTQLSQPDFRHLLQEENDMLAKTGQVIYGSEFASQLRRVLYERERDQVRSVGIKYAVSSRLNALIGSFSRLESENKSKYMFLRLDWIHRAGLDDQAPATIQLPGVTARARFDEIAIVRNIRTLHNQEHLRAKLLDEFDSYNSRVREPFRRDDVTFYRRAYGSGAPFPVVGLFSREIENPEYVPAIFMCQMAKLYKHALYPDIKSSDYSEQFTEQLSLPPREESYVIYKEYQSLAPYLIRRNFKIRDQLQEKKVEGAINRFNELKSETQKSFLHYVKKPSATFYALADLAPLGLDFSPITSGNYNGAATQLIALLGSQTTIEETDKITTIAHRIRSLQKSTGDTVKLLLEKEDSNRPVGLLFQDEVLQFAKELNDLSEGLELSKGQEDATKESFFTSVIDPVWLAIYDFTNPNSARFSEKVKNEARQSLEDFRRLNDKDQEAVLHQLATGLYQPGGPNGLDPISTLVAQANSWNSTAALLCASLLVLPLLLVCLVAGGFFARKLIARDRMREMVAKEEEGYPETDRTLGTPVEMYGTDDALRNMRNLSERGWSTIGVVGRRGVGKSRLLYALTQIDPDRPETPTIKVWVASPSRFQEEDFIASMFERLALSAEAAISTFLGVKPLSIRRIESRSAQVGTWLYFGALILLITIVYGMYSRLTRPDIVITWVPILALIFTSLGFLISHLSKLQPVDLTFWLQRDRTHNPHTVMLYQEVSEALRFLRRRAQGAIREYFWQGRGLLRTFAMLALGCISIVVGFYALYLMARGADEAAAVFFYIALISLSLMFFLYHQHRLSSGDRTLNYGQSLMSLIATYRSFASAIVYRLKQGAIGHQSERKFSVLICVDELDKIVDFEEIRTFVRRIKAIFEVPGIYYYVSLAEDTLTSLYLGPSVGKNEIDSSFDHIIRIQPLSCDVSEVIARRYLNSHGFTELPNRLPRTLAAISFGIPRDIIRRCDEFIARTDSKSVQPEILVANVRKTQATLGYELKQLSSLQVVELTRDPIATIQSVARMLTGDELSVDSQKLLLSLGVI